MTISVVSICNRALDLLGADPITALTDSSKAARLCNRNYESVRDAVLRAYPWNCAMSRAALAALTDTPAFDYAYQYQAPADFLRMWRINDDDEGLVKWRLEGRKILTDQAAPLYIVYIKQVADPAELDALCADVIAARLAAEIAYSLTGSASVKQEAMQGYRDKLGEARKVDAQEIGTPEEFTAPDWIESRL